MTGTGHRASSLPRSKRALFVAATLVVTLALLEGVLQVASRASSRVARFLSSGTRAPLADPVLGTRPNPALPDHDSAGWRNAERPVTAPIVAVGDSQTYGVGASLRNTWPARVEARTGYRTYDMAHGGYGAAEYWLLTEEALALEPRLVLIGLYAGNDLADTYQAVYREGRAQELRTEDPAVLAELRQADATRPEIAADWNRMRAARRGPVARRYHAWVGAGVESLKLYSLVRAAGHSIAADGGLRQDVDRTDWDRYVRDARDAEEGLLFPFRDGDVGTVLTPRARLAVVDTTDPRIAEGLRASIVAIRRIRDRLAGRAEMAVVLIPTKELVYAERVRRAGVATPQAYDRMVESEARMWRQAQAALEAEGVPWIATLEALRGALARNENPYQMSSDGHPNRLGYDAIAMAVAESAVVRGLAGSHD